jgi:protein-L-isoaspartate(D-aspartate) O-methyltransferase
VGQRPLPIGCGQTISQPLVVARMCELLELRGDERSSTSAPARATTRRCSPARRARLDASSATTALSEQAQNNRVPPCDQRDARGPADGARRLPAAAPFDAINDRRRPPRPGRPALEQQLGHAGGSSRRSETATSTCSSSRRTAHRVQAQTALERVRFVVPLV